MKISSRITKVDKALTRLTNGQYSDVDIHWVCDSISWLKRFGHIDDKQTKEFTDRAIEILKCN